MIKLYREDAVMEKIKYGGWDNCYRLANSQIELIVTADVGPRIIRFGFIGGKNIFKEYPEQLGKTNSDKFLSFGGHRLWHAPESLARTYYPDMEPVLVQEIENGLMLTQKPEPTTGIQKQIKIILSPNEPEVQLTHYLINHNLWAVEAAPWSISVMSPGGVAILPLPPRGPHPDNLLPTSTISLWPYTNLTDPRYQLGERYIIIRQDSNFKTPQKIGLYASDGWAAYSINDAYFIKQVPIHFEGVYPDMGTNFEVFTDYEMLELEALGPLESIPPKGKIDHLEHWTLINNVPQIKSETDVLENLVSLL
jgi:hypothetical protein